MDILGEVAEYLKKPELDKAASTALLKIWHRPPNDDPAISELMTQGCNLMVVQQKQMPQMEVHQGAILMEQAEKIFSHIIQLDPAFAEVCHQASWEVHGAEMSCFLFLKKGKQATKQLSFGSTSKTP